MWYFFPVSANAPFRSVLMFWLLIWLSSNIAIGTVSHTLATTVDHHCTDSVGWIGAGATLHDCVAAVEQLHETDAQVYVDLDVEFFSSNAKGRAALSRKSSIK